VPLRGPVPEPTEAVPAEEVTAAMFLRGLRLAILGIVSSVLLFLDVPQALANSHVYRPAALEVAAYGLLIGVTLVCWVLVLGQFSFDRWRWPLVAVVLVAEGLGTAAIPGPEMMGPAHGLYGVIGWFVVLVLLDRPLPTLVAVLVAHNVLTLTQLVLAGQTDRITLSAMAAKGTIDFALEFVAGYSAFALRRIAQEAAEDAAEEERFRIAQAVTADLARERRSRWAALRHTTVPLLVALASREQDPTDPQFQRACAIEAARLRRLISESDDAPDPLLNELQSCIGLAELRGVDVSLAMRGQRPALATDVRRALTEPVVAAMATAVSSARITVVAHHTAVTVSVVADASQDEARAALAVSSIDLRPVEVTGVATEDGLWVEATWRAQG
jgi:hypothetical protein